MWEPAGIDAGRRPGALSMLVLASTSQYRHELLTRLRLPFTTFAPHVDETPAIGESPQETAMRLAKAKACAAQNHFPTALIIGSDQVAELDGRRLEKPGSRERAREQLNLASGREIVFHTALALLQSRSGKMESALVPTTVRFRTLTDPQIEAYLELEQPYDCAGSAKSEGLGITLLERITGDDPTALIGLPLIALSTMLVRFGMDPLALTTRTA
jgi:7-methyl-GTP pyrophosphatase